MKTTIRLLFIIFIFLGTNTVFGAGNCNIKGNIGFKTGEKIYHLPSCSDYNETVIRTQYGEKWFCSEQEAINAGWRKSYNCDNTSSFTDNLFKDIKPIEKKDTSFTDNSFKDTPTEKITKTSDELLENLCYDLNTGIKDDYRNINLGILSDSVDNALYKLEPIFGWAENRCEGKIGEYFGLKSEEDEYTSQKFVFFIMVILGLSMYFNGKKVDEIEKLESELYSKRDELENKNNELKDENNELKNKIEKIQNEKYMFDEYNNYYNKN